LTEPGPWYLGSTATHRHRALCCGAAQASHLHLYGRHRLWP